MRIRVHPDSSYFKTELTNGERGTQEGNSSEGGKNPCHLVVFTTAIRLREIRTTFQNLKKRGGEGKENDKLVTVGYYFFFACLPSS